MRADDLVVTLEFDRSVQALLMTVVEALYEADLEDVAEQQLVRMFGRACAIEGVRGAGVWRFMWKPYAELALRELLAIARRPLPRDVQRRLIAEVLELAGFGR